MTLPSPSHAASLALALVLLASPANAGEVQVIRDPSAVKAFQERAARLRAAQVTPDALARHFPRRRYLGPEDVETLASNRPVSVAFLRRTAQDASQELGQRLKAASALARLDPAAGLKCFEAALGAEPPAEAWLAFAQALGSVNVPLEDPEGRFQALLTPLLRHSNPELRETAWWALSRLPATPALEALCLEATPAAERAEERSAWANTLGDLGLSARAVEALRRCAKEEPKRERRRAYAEALVDLAQRCEETRSAALEALAKVVPLLDDGGRRYVSYLLAKPDLARESLPILRREAARGEQAAARALLCLAPPAEAKRTLQALLAAPRDPEEEVELLLCIAETRPLTAEAARQLLALLPEQPRDFLQLLTLARAGTPEARARVTKALTQGRVPAEERVALWWGQLGWGWPELLKPFVEAKVLPSLPAQLGPALLRSFEDSPLGAPTPGGLVALLQQLGAAYAYDAEAGVIPPPHGQLVRDLIEATKALELDWVGQLATTQQSPRTELGVISRGRLYKVEVQVEGDHYDSGPVLELLNAILKDQGQPKRFQLLKGSSQIAEVLLGEPKALETASKAVGLVLNGTQDSARATGQAFEERMQKRFGLKER